MFHAIYLNSSIILPVVFQKSSDPPLQRHPYLSFYLPIFIFSNFGVHIFLSSSEICIQFLFFLFLFEFGTQTRLQIICWVFSIYYCCNFLSFCLSRFYSGSVVKNVVSFQFSPGGMGILCLHFHVFLWLLVATH